MLQKFKQNPVLIGISFALFQTICAALVGMFAKLSSDFHHPTEVMFYRSFFCLLIVTAVLAASKKLHLLKTANIRNQTIRGVIGSMGMIATFWSFAILPLSEIQSILFAAPIFVAALSFPILKEKVGIYRTAATIVGFIGVLLIVQPGVISSFMGGMLGLVAAFFHAAIILILRWLGKTEEPIVTVFYFALISTIIMLPVMPFTMSMPSLHSLGLLSMVGISVFGLQMSLTKAYVYADATVIAPITYISLLWMLIMDFLIWDFIPKPMTLIGAGIVISSSLVIIIREAKVAGIKKRRTQGETL